MIGTLRPENKRGESFFTTPPLSPRPLNVSRPFYHSRNAFCAVPENPYGLPSTFYKEGFPPSLGKFEPGDENNITKKPALDVCRQQLRALSSVPLNSQTRSDFRVSSDSKTKRVGEFGRRRAKRNKISRQH